MAREKKPAKEQGTPGGRTTGTKGDLIRTEVYLDPDEHEALELAALERSSTASEVARQALREHLGVHPSEPGTPKPPKKSKESEWHPLALTRDFDSVVELMDHLRPERWKSTWVFRGQRDASWTLMPAAIRRSSDETKGEVPLTSPSALDLWTHLRGEWSSVYRFAVEADRIGLDAQLSASAHSFNGEVSSVQFIPSAEAEFPPAPLLDLFSLAQHHGIPTRLLDWSSNPFVAAFFAAQGAVSSEAKVERIAVWALDTRFLHGQSLEFGGDSGFQPAPLHYFSTSYYRHLFQRVQRGGFTVDRLAASHFMTGGSWRPHCAAIEHWWNATEGTVIRKYCPELPLIKYTAPLHTAPEILERLRRYDITLVDLMPSLDNVARMIVPSGRRHF